MKSSFIHGQEDLKRRRGQYKKSVDLWWLARHCCLLRTFIRRRRPTFKLKRFKLTHLDVTRVHFKEGIYSAKGTVEPRAHVYLSDRGVGTSKEPTPNESGAFEKKETESLDIEP